MFGAVRKVVRIVFQRAATAFEESAVGDLEGGSESLAVVEGEVSVLSKFGGASLSGGLFDGRPRVDRDRLESI